MKVLSVSLQNFASYKNLDFDFTNQGLTLIQGPTGAGKSTLCDAIPWLLFGRTAKGGAVDEIRSWNTNQVTSGHIGLSTGDVIVRVRGATAKDNDLYYRTRMAEIVRGKDLNDTQRLINQLLGMDYDLYMAGAYYHEFSQTAQFFTTTAKNRRNICEQLVDLSLPIKLRDGISEKRKLHTESLREINGKISQLKSNIDLLQRLQGAESTKAQNWEVNNAYNLARTMEQYEKFELGRKRIISNKCNSCGTILSAPINITDNSVNPFMDRIEGFRLAANPHTGATKDYTAEIDSKETEARYLENEIQGLNVILGDLDALQTVTEDLRSTTISNTIKYLESTTNESLANYFDSEIRVEFETSTADKIEVEIYKDGNTCAYTQLSKGQRCLLKLCFGVAVMEAVQNHHGISFDQIFFDESLDGLDDNFKTKAYRLFETLAQRYNSIFLVEHNEALKSMFSSSYSVQLINGSSEIAKA